MTKATINLSSNPPSLDDFGLGRWWAQTPFIFSERYLQGLEAQSDENLSLSLHTLIRPAFDAYKHSGRAAALLPVSMTFNRGTQRFRSRNVFILARALGFEAGLHLAAAGPGAATEALRAAETAVSLAGAAQDVSEYDRLVFLAENEMVAAVALKALGNIEECIEHCRAAAKLIGEKAIIIPLLRQWALVEQDGQLFDRVVALSESVKGVPSREKYRSLKRSLEFSLNNNDVNGSERLLPQVLHEFREARDNLDHIAHVSLIKNLGQFIGLKGSADRAFRVLTLAGVLAHEADFGGQERQIAGLLADLQEGQKLSLETFRLI